MSSPSTDQTLPIGAMIEEFRVVRILGTGSFGVVYQCDNSYLDETVAIKEFLPTELAARQPTGNIEPLSPAYVEPFGWALDRFLQEAKTLWDLGRPVRHPNIVRVTRFRKLNGSAYMFMEFEHGRPFSALLEQRGPLEFEALLAIVEPLLSGLQRVHASGILHRDIKPANILIRDDGSPVLIDFGSAKAVSQSGEQSIFATYTPLYAALEQHQDVGDQGPWTDIYGLGATLYRAVTGQPPKSASQRLLSSNPQLPATEAARGRYPEPFLQAIDLACSLQPEKRPQSIAEWRALILDDTQSPRYQPTIVKPRPSPEGGAETFTAVKPPADSEQTLATSTLGKANTVPPSPREATATRKRPLGLALAGGLAILIAAILGWILLAPDHGTPEISSGIEIRLPPPAPDRPSSAENYEALARDHFRKGEIKQSLELVDLGLAASPRDPRLLTLREYIRAFQKAQAIVERATRILESGDIEGSLAIIDAGLEEIPEHPDLLALRNKALEQQQKHRLEQAIQRLGQATQRLEQAQALYQQGKLDEALTIVEQANRLTDDESAFRALSTAREGGKAYQQELVELKAALRSLGDTIEDDKARQQQVAEMIAKIRQLMQQGEFESADKQLPDALRLDPDNPELARLDAAIQSERDSKREARIADVVKRAQEALDDDKPNRALAIVKEGLAEAPNEDRLQQLEARATDRIDEIDARDDLYLAQAFARRGDYQKSLALIAQGLEARPGNPALLALRDEVEAQRDQEAKIDRILTEAQNLRDQGDLEASLARVKEGLGISPDDKELQTLSQALTEALNEQHRLEAKRLIEQAEELATQDRLEEAIERLDAAVLLTPEDTELPRLRDRYLKRLDEDAQVATMITECNALLFEMENDLKDIQRSSDCFKRVLQIDATNELAADGLAQTTGHLVELSTDAIKNRNLDLAQASLSLLRTLAPEHPQLPAMQRDLELIEHHLLPEMIAVAGGCYMMGSPSDEPGREPDEESHQVCLEPFAIGKHEVTVADFARFVEATDYKTDAERGTGGVQGCWALDREATAEAWGYRDWANWRTPNKYQQQTDTHPVSCVSWHDAQAYLAWLNKETGRSFRLPTEAEWEYAARAGSTGARYWSDLSTSCQYASVADMGWKDGFDCQDGNEWVAATGQYTANPWGIHDILGNLWEWTCSEYEQQYAGKERLCSPTTNREPRVMRGGAWNSGVTSVRAAYRNRFFPEARYNFVGFRLARDQIRDASVSTDP